MPKFLGGESLANNHQECHQSASHVQCVESGGDVESASVRVRIQHDTFLNQVGIFPNLT